MDQIREETTPPTYKLQISIFFNVTPYMFLPTLYTDMDMSAFGMVIVLAFHIHDICNLLYGLFVKFSNVSP